MQKIKISIVSYINTLPFIYSLERDKEMMDSIVLEKDIPSVCAKKLYNGDADLGLVPVVVIPEIKNAQIISDYCIGADGPVKSVLLVSAVPLNEIETIFLDYQSRTSINLVRILAKYYWRITPKWIKAEKGFEHKLGGTRAGVIIGDRTFELPESLPYRYDLAAEWKLYSGWPFVFACWVANKQLPTSFISDFNKTLETGFHNLKDVVSNYQNKYAYLGIDLFKYFSQDISYKLDGTKKQGMGKFMQLYKQLHLP